MYLGGSPPGCPIPCCIKAFSPRTDHKLWTAGALACARNIVRHAIPSRSTEKTPCNIHELECEELSHPFALCQIGDFYRFLNHLATLRIPNYPCDWKPCGEPFYAKVWRIGWLNTRSWRLHFLWPSRSRSLLFLLLSSGTTSTN